MRKESLLPLTGLLFIVLLIASFFVAGEPPQADDDVAEIVEHYVDNDTAIYIGAFMFGAAAISLLVFASYLRRLFSEAQPGASLLPGLILVGASILAVGGAIDTTLLIAMVEAAEDIEPESVQTLQALWDNDFIPIALGIAVFIGSAGLATLSTGALPKWLGWAAIAIFVVGFAGPAGFVAFPLSGLWVVVVSILLSVRADRTATTA